MNAELVESYRLAVEAQNLRAEAATGGYETELARYFGTDGAGDGVETRLTFKQWLIDHRRPVDVDVVDPAPVEDRRVDFFRLTGRELIELAAAGSEGARAEIARRAERRATKRAAKAA